MVCMLDRTSNTLVWGIVLFWVWVVWGFFVYLFLLLQDFVPNQTHDLAKVELISVAGDTFEIRYLKILRIKIWYSS